MQYCSSCGEVWPEGWQLQPHPSVTHPVVEGYGQQRSQADGGGVGQGGEGQGELPRSAARLLGHPGQWVQVTQVTTGLHI